MKKICVLAVSLYAVSMAFAVPEPVAPATIAGAPAEPEVSGVLEGKIRAEWEALKLKDQKTYGDLLADDYEGVEIDGAGERTKLQAIREVPAGNVHNYTLWGFRLTRVGPEAVLAIYEVTILFPPGSALHYSRLYISELWVQRAGEWKELHYQETHVR